MARRKLSKKDFEQMLNEKAEKMLTLLDIDLTGMDDYYESWKAQRRAAPGKIINQCRPELASKKALRLNNPPEFGTWLRRQVKEFDIIRVRDFPPHNEFEQRYANWVETHA